MTYFTFHTFLNFLRTHYKKEKTSRPKEKSTYTDQFFFNAFLPEDKDPKSKATVSNYSNGKSHPYIDDWDINALCLEDMESVILEFIPAKITDKKKASDFEELKSLMLSSQNIIDDAIVNHEITQIDDLFSLLYYAFVYLYNNQKKIFDKYSYEEITSSWQISETHESDSKTSNANSITDKSPRTPAIITALSAISAYMYQKILSNESRYHSAHIDHTLLSFGKVTVKNRSLEDPNENTLMHYFDSSKKNLYIYGPGGIGKTTFLITLMKQYHECKNSYIPLYLSLADLKKYTNSTYDEDDQSTSCISAALWDRFKKCKKGITGDNAVAINRYTEDSFKDLLNKIMQHASSSHKILLLLDGINEISIEKNSYIRSRLMEEMQQLSGFTNIRIIATTRPFPIIENDFLRNCISIEATGIETKLLFKILDINKLSIPDDELLSILKVPLFLNMYISVQKQNRTNASTRGAILYDFYNNIVSQYNEKSHDKQLQKNDPDRHTVIPLILDFILPAFAARMEMEDCFTLPKSIFHDIIENRKAYIKPFIHQSNSIISKIYPDEEYLEDAIEEIPNAKTVLKIVRDQLSLFTVYSDINEELSFTHQYIRDYFASIFRLTAIGSCSFDDNSVYADYLSHVLSPETLELSNEILNYSEIYNSPLIIDKAFKQSAFSDQPMILKNLLDQLSAYYKNDLSTYHFKGIDFSRQQMSNYQFYNYAQKEAATFSNCIFSDESFDTYNGHKTILHTIGFLKRPVLCELSIGDIHTYYKIIDLYSMSVLKTYILDTAVSLDAIAHCNSLIVSDDLQYFIITSSNFDGNYYLCNPNQGNMKLYSIDGSKITFHFTEGKLLYVIDDFFLYEMNLISGDFLKYNIFDSKFLMNDPSYAISCSLDHTTNVIFDELGNLLLISDNENCFSCLYYYDRLKQHTFCITPQSQLEDAHFPSHYSNSTRYAVSNGYIYILLKNGIYKRGLSSQSNYKLLIPDDHLYFQEGLFFVYNDLLYFFNYSFTYIYNSWTGELIKNMPGINSTINFAINTFSNSNYLVFAIPNDNLSFLSGNTTYIAFNLNDFTFINREYSCYPKLTHSTLLNDSILLYYNSTYLYLINKLTMNILDSLILSEKRIINTTYNPHTNTLVLLVYNNNSINTPNYQLLFYNFTKKTPDNWSMNDYDITNKYLFSTNGRYFFIVDNKNNQILSYSATDFTFIQKLFLENVKLSDFSFYTIPTENGFDLLYSAEDCVLPGSSNILNNKHNEYCLRLSFKDSNKMTSRLFVIPSIDINSLFSCSDIAFTGIAPNIIQAICLSDNTIISNNTIVELDPNNNLINTYKFSDLKCWYFILDGIFVPFEEYDLIKNDFLVKDFNNRHYFYRRDMKCKGISIPGMKIDDNCHFDKEHNRFLGESQKGIFTAIDLDTRSRVAEATFSIGMMIKDCRFINCKFENSYTRTVIENNGGIIEN